VLLERSAQLLSTEVSSERDEAAVFLESAEQMREVSCESLAHSEEVASASEKEGVTLVVGLELS